MRNEMVLGEGAANGSQIEASDTVRVSASCWFDERNPPPLDLTRFRWGQKSIAGYTKLSLGTAKIAGVSAESRQRALARESRRLLDNAIGAGLDGTVVADNGLQVTLYISLSPGEGSADIILEAGLYRGWADLGAALHVDVI